MNNDKEKFLRMVFGDCGTAFIVGLGDSSIGFHIHSDGAGSPKFIVPEDAIVTVGIGFAQIASGYVLAKSKMIALLMMRLMAIIKSRRLSRLLSCPNIKVRSWSQYVKRFT